MANSEHLEILKQGVEIWNQWREDNKHVKPNLFGVDFAGASLRDANLCDVNLGMSDLSEADLFGANLRYASVHEAKLIRANLREAKADDANFNLTNMDEANLFDANLSDANLFAVRLGGANLCGANLGGAYLGRANFEGADLRDTDLTLTIFKDTYVNDADFSNATCDGTIFANIDLSEAIGLADIWHRGRSNLDIDTLYLSYSKLPEVFLRGCGVPDNLISYLPSLFEDALQFYSCFISYSHDDKEFARLLHDRLQGQGIRCWLDEHQLKPGNKLHSTIYNAIRVYDKVILCCSKSSLTSWWVEKEVEHAIDKEETCQDTVLIPLALDDYIFGRSRKNWVVSEIRKRFVQSFLDWKDHDAFSKAFQPLVNALRSNLGPPHPKPKLKPKRKKR